MMPSLSTLKISELKACSPFLQDMSSDDDDDVDLSLVLQNLHITPASVQQILQKDHIVISDDAIIAADKLHVQSYIDEAAFQWIKTKGNFELHYSMLMTILTNKAIQYEWKKAMRSACARSDELAMMNLWIEELKDFCITLWPNVRSVRVAALLYQKRVPLLTHHMFYYTDSYNPSESEMDVFEYLLMKNCFRKNINDLLMRACQVGSIKAIDVLLSAGADINYVNQVNNTPLYNALDQQNLSVYKYLLKRGALETHASKNKFLTKQYRGFFHGRI